MLKRIDAIFAALEQANGEYELYEISPSMFEKNMRETRSKGAAAGKVGLVRKSVFVNEGEFVCSVRIGDVMSKEDEAVERIVKHKANLMISCENYEKYIKDVLKKKEILKKHGIRDSEEAVKAFVKVFRMGAVDAMIFDVGAALNCEEWKRQGKRKKMLMELFCELG